MEDVQPGLAALLHPVDVATFLTEHWPDRHLHLAGDSWRQLIDIPDLYEADRLLNRWSGDVSVFLDDDYDRFTVNGPLALRLFRRGTTVGLIGIQNQYPELGTWLDRLGFDLGLSIASKLYGIVFLSARGRRMEPHFDTNLNLVLQLTGHKRWWLAPNTHAPFPTRVHTVAMAGPHQELVSYLNGAMPTAMPEGAAVVDLRPGSFLFLPPGIWHATEALEDSISLNFVVRLECWAELVCRKLHRILIQDVAWRKPARGAGTLNQAVYAAGDAALEALLPMLRAAVDRAGVADFVGRALGCSKHARFRFEGSLVTVDTLKNGATFDCSDADARFLAWIANRDEPFTLSDLAQHGHDWEGFLSIITTLTAMEVLYVL